MLVYLVRHAIAGLRDPERWPDDRQRPLTKRGKRRFRRAARGLATLVSSVELVLSSPSVRAWSTAELLSKEAGWPDPVACDALVDSPPAAVAAVVREHADFASLALVGHQPYLNEFAASLLGPTGSAHLELRKGGAICFRIDDPTTLSGATLLWLLQPKVLRALR